MVVPWNCFIERINGSHPSYMQRLKRTFCIWLVSTPGTSSSVSPCWPGGGCPLGFALPRTLPLKRIYLARQTVRRRSTWNELEKNIQNDKPQLYQWHCIDWPCAVATRIKVVAGDAAPRLEPELREVIETVVAEEDEAAGLQILVEVHSHRLHVSWVHGRLERRIVSGPTIEKWGQESKLSYKFECPDYLLVLMAGPIYSLGSRLNY